MGVRGGPSTINLWCRARTMVFSGPASCCSSGTGIRYFMCAAGALRRRVKLEVRVTDDAGRCNMLSPAPAPPRSVSICTFNKTPGVKPAGSRLWRGAEVFSQPQLCACHHGVAPACWPPRRCVADCFIHYSSPNS